MPVLPDGAGPASEARRCTRENQCSTPRKRRAGSNLADMGRFAARDLSPLERVAVNSEAVWFPRWGGHGEGLRRSRGDAVGV